MSVELGSIWIDNDSEFLVIVKSLEGKSNGGVKVIFNYIDGTSDKLFEASSGLDLFLKTKTQLVRNTQDEYSKGYENGVQQMKMQSSIDKYLEMSDKVSLTEEEFEGIIDEAFEEGYAQAYSEIKKSEQNLNYRMGLDDGYESGYKDAYEEMYYPNNERERALQEKAWDEGYSQAISDVIDEDFEGGYSEYEFGDVEDEEEEYCFSKELDKILKSGQEQYEADPSVPSMGNRYDENGKLCGFFINTGNEKIGGINGSERKHSHYFKDVRHLDYLDVYELNKLFPIDDDTDCILHARKKLLVCGGRGGSKDMITDITEARDTLNRYLQIEGIE